MEVGVTMGTGQNVQPIAVEVLRPDPEPAPTLPLLMVEQIVREISNKNNPVTLTPVQVKRKPLICAQSSYIVVSAHASCYCFVQLLRATQQIPQNSHANHLVRINHND